MTNKTAPHTQHLGAGVKRSRQGEHAGAETAVTDGPAPPGPGLKDALQYF